MGSLRGAGLPRVHALLLVRDEADIIAQTLEHLLSWAAGVYVLDTGSTDGTWELVRERAGRGAGVFAEQTAEMYQCGLRSALFERHRHRFGRGDWIARVDADEFYHVPPPEFIRERVRAHEGRVAVWQYLFVLTREEARAWRQGGRAWRARERERAIEDRRRWFIRHPFPEVRLYRYRPSMRWLAGRADPANPGPMAIERIPVRHYRFRDPAQIRARVRLRSGIAGQTDMVGRHWEVGGVGACLVEEGDPELGRWEEGDALPGVEGWADAGAHLRVTPTGRLGRACHRMGMGWVLDLVAR